MSAPHHTLNCTNCLRVYPPGATYICEDCWGPLEPRIDLDQFRGTLTHASIAAGPPSMWRYHQLLPVEAPSHDELVGYTPLRHAPRLAKEIGLRNLWLKDDTLNPSGSFKDRVVATALAKAREIGCSVVVAASTGNLGNAVAAAAARAQLRSIIIVPADLEPAKIAMSAIYGAHVVTIDGTYDDANRLCVELLDAHPEWAFVNVNLRPYYAEGSKTLAFEICEQLGWTTPDHVVVPVASGSQLTKIHRGFSELREVGLTTSKMPRLHAAQPLGSSPIALAHITNKAVAPVRPHTLTRSLAIGNPADATGALETLRATNGAAVCVEDSDMIDAISLLARTEGIFVEPAGGVSIHALRDLVARGVVAENDSVVVVLSGHGLKTIDVVASRATPLAHIQPSLGAFEKLRLGD